MTVLSFPASEIASPTPSHVPDDELLRRLRLSDTGALDILLDRYWAGVVDYVTRLTGARDAAEDVAQQTFCQLWDHRGSWRPAGSLRALLYRIGRNLAVSEERRRGARERSAAVFVEGMPSGCTPVDELENAQLRVALDRAIGALPLRQREVFVLRCTHNLSYKEVAAVLDLAPQTVANQLSKALTTLRRVLRPMLDA
jgi:RNA polymerase sigma-70 factor (ECF subfamily)